MGGFYGSVQVRSEDRAAVLAAAEAVAKAKKIRCLAGPALKGWIGIYPENNGQDQSVGEEIAQETGGVVLHVMVHDDDVLAYWLWRDRVLVDEHWSKPGYFGDENLEDEERRSGNAEQFRFVLDDAGVGKLRELLGRDEAAPVFEFERLEKFGQLLGIGNLVAAFEYLQGGETDGMHGWPEDFQLLPRPESRPGPTKSGKSQKWSGSGKVSGDRQRLMDSGVLMAVEERAAAGPLPIALADDFLVFWGGLSQETTERWTAPWNAPTRVAGIEFQPDEHLAVVATDITGRRVAAMTTDGIRVWDAAGEGFQLVMRRRLGAHAGLKFALSPDGDRVVYSTRDQLVLASAADGQVLNQTTPGLHKGPWSGLAFDSEGHWFVAAGSTVRLLSMANPRQSITLFMGGRIPRPTAASILAKLDSAKLLAATQAESQKMLKRMAGMGMSAEEREKFRQEVDNQMTTLREQVQAAQLKTEPPEKSADDISKEYTYAAGFTRNGRWLWCSTVRGLRVFDAAAVRETASRPTSQAFWFAFPDPLEGARTKRNRVLVHAMVEEPANLGGRAGAMVMGTSDGRLYRMDLGDGKTRQLGAIPSGGVIASLTMLADGQALGIAWGPSHRSRGQAAANSHLCWEIWSYSKLLQLAGLG